MSDSTPLLSLVIPAWNEEDALPPTVERIAAVVDGDDRLTGNTEVVVVNDGSADDTSGAARKALDGVLPGTVVDLAGNVGSHAAIRCGLRHTTGEIVVILSADGQDPPESIPAMLDAVEDGAEVVWGRRTSRTADPAARRFLASSFYRFYRAATGLEYPPSGLDFVALRRPVVETLERYRERNMPLFLLVYNLGFRQTIVPYVRGERSQGESGWSLRKRIKLGVDMLTAFSATPLRLVSVAGLFIGGLGLLFGLVTLIRGFVVDVPVTGWASLMVMTSVMGGTILLAISVLGEYVWRTLDEVRGRPIYLERTVTELASVDPAAEDE